MASASDPFDWETAMAFGLGVLKLSPAAFWAMTPRELQAAMIGVHGHPSEGPPSKATLTALMQRYPDEVC